jgi:hypothetical protein
MNKHERQFFKNNISRKRKERHKIVSSKNWICKACGYIGKPKKEKQGSWFFTLYRLLLCLFLIIVFPVSLFIDALMIVFRGSRNKTTFFGKNYGRFLMSMPFNLFECKECHIKNSMIKLKSQDGRIVYDSFARDRFIKTRDW